jgi:hypothetical protein
MCARIIFLLLFFQFCVFAKGFRIPKNIILPSKKAKHPIITYTEDELARLRKAYTGNGIAKKVLDTEIRRANRVLRHSLVFPKQGGQHEAHYRCPKHKTKLIYRKEKHFCPLCKKNYKNQRFDEVIYGRIHTKHLKEMALCARAYTVTRQLKYALQVRKILLGYAQRYLKYNYHGSEEWNFIYNWVAGGRIFSQTLTEASALVKYIVPAYDSTHDSGVYTSIDHKRIQDKFLYPMLRNIEKHKGGISNWQAWHNGAMFYGGILLRDKGLVQKALFDGWSEHGETDLGSELIKWGRYTPPKPGNGFFYQLRYALTKDGLWYEGSWASHFYALEALGYIAEGGRRLGYVFWEHPQLKKSVYLPLLYQMPNDQFPRFNDDPGTAVKSKQGLYEQAYGNYSDKRLATFLPDRLGWQAVVLGRNVLPLEKKDLSLQSVLFKWNGHAVLRTKGDARITTAVTFGPYTGHHKHFDTMSYVWYAYKQECGVDHGRTRQPSFHLPIHHQWYKASISHNVVLVDRRSQEPSSAKYELYKAEDQYACLALTMTKGYPGVTHQRLFLQSADFLLVIDYLKSKSDRWYDWVYHHKCEKIETNRQMTAATLKELPGSEYMKNLQKMEGFHSDKILFRENTLNTYAYIMSNQKALFITGNGPSASVAERVPFVMMRQRGKTAVFIALFEPTPQGRLPKIFNTNWQDKNGIWHISILASDQERLIKLRPMRWLEVIVKNQTVFSVK